MSEKKNVSFNDKDTVCYLKNCIVNTDTKLLSECNNLWIGENGDIRENPDGPMIGLLPFDCKFTPGWQNKNKDQEADQEANQEADQEADNLVKRLKNLNSDDKKFIEIMITSIEEKNKMNKKNKKKTRKLQI